MSGSSTTVAEHSPCFLLTDFGDRDAYVGVMKAVMLSAAPSLPIVDLCHAIEPQNVLSAGYVLLTAVPYLPDGSIVVAVVDPGVGTRRRIVGIVFEGWTLLVPDNGLVSLVLERYQCRSAWEIAWERLRSSPPCATFHGRDIFAPCAALLATKKRTLAHVGNPIDPASLVRLDTRPEARPQGIVASILHVDRFGNLITNVEAAPWGIVPGADWVCRVGQDVLPLVSTFGNVEPGESLAYIGSSGFIEIAVCNSSAAARYGTRPPVFIHHAP
ncbi:MAG: hypothetical protein KatS3mg039_0223 [Candidatus Kapaibacterium sp.]|nr:MAG: hypothetical protein KatS3mg039_0223 [Candidatus Kapabacteria bacterium]